MSAWPLPPALVRLGDRGGGVSTGALLGFGLLTAFAPETLRAINERHPVSLLAAIAAVLAAGLLGLATVAGVGKRWRRPLRGQPNWICVAPAARGRRRRTLGACASAAVLGACLAAGEKATLTGALLHEGALRLGAAAVILAAVGLLVPALMSRYRLVVAGALAAAGVQTALYFWGVESGL